MGGAEDVEKRQEVVGRRDGVVGVRAALEVDDGFVRARFDGRLDGLVEAVGGRIPVLVLPFDEAQVVDDVAAAHDEIALLAKHGELLAELVRLARIHEAVDGELDDGDVGPGEDVDEDAPGAVIDAPAVVDFDAIAEQVCDFFCQVSAACGLVLELVELLGEAVHVVDLARLCGALHERAARIPVRGDHQDGLGAAEAFQDGLTEFFIRCRQVVVFKCDHRAAVPDENRRHARFLLFHVNSSFLFGIISHLG